MEGAELKHKRARYERGADGKDGGSELNAVALGCSESSKLGTLCQEGWVNDHERVKDARSEEEENKGENLDPTIALAEGRVGNNVGGNIGGLNLSCVTVDNVKKSRNVGKNGNFTDEFLRGGEKGGSFGPAFVPVVGRVGNIGKRKVGGSNQNYVAAGSIDRGESLTLDTFGREKGRSFDPSSVRITDIGEVLRRPRRKFLSREQLFDYLYKPAMEYFNKTNDTEFEDMVPLGCNSFPAAGFWYHFNFKAKPKNADSSADPSPKLFFGEGRFFVNGFTVEACCILEPDNAATTCLGCDVNGQYKHIVFHPSSGFTGGVPTYSMK